MPCTPFPPCSTTWHFFVVNTTWLKCAKTIACVKSWLAPHMHKLRGYTTGQFGDGMHEFLLREDREGGRSGALTEIFTSLAVLDPGRGGLASIFSSDTPTASPPFAKLKPDNLWERQVVEGTVRLWLPHMELARTEDRQAARKERNKRL
eukprot:6173346-Pleurochrysis_carterae.AAC.1